MLIGCRLNCRFGSIFRHHVGTLPGLSIGGAADAVRAIPRTGITQPCVRTHKMKRRLAIAPAAALLPAAHAAVAQSDFNGLARVHRALGWVDVTDRLMTHPQVHLNGSGIHFDGGALPVGERRIRLSFHNTKGRAVDVTETIRILQGGSSTCPAVAVTSIKPSRIGYRTAWNWQALVSAPPPPHPPPASPAAA